MNLPKKVKDALFDVTPKKPLTERNSWFSALLSAFIPGLGQIYNGLILRGSVYLIGLNIILYFWLGYLYQSIIHGLDSPHPISFWQIFCNTITVLLFFYIYIHCIIDAYSTAGAINKSLESTNSSLETDFKKCRKCGYDVGLDAEKCPICSSTLKGRFNFGYIVAIAVSVIAFLVFYPLAKQSLNELSKRERFQISKKGQKTFNENIEYHYNNLLSSFYSKKYDKTIEILKLFSSADRLDYKDVQSIYSKANMYKLEKQNSLIPKSNFKEKLRIYKQLLKLSSNNTEYKERVRYYENQVALAESDLAILSRRWFLKSGLATVEGEVKNISKRALERVQTIITWYDKDGKMVTSDTAFIEKDPIFPGHTSPFRIIKSYNPSMKTAKIEFKDIAGNSIPTYLSEK
jgi:tetratricopeptide (TPR) repeat protein